mmetsp:Transcript_22679/g.43053  ORF Transcript_22679/g.43053 Transcript_22679/m.43053 type:complete len:205 (-) Transcript_22679:862-1476(-)
MSTSTTPTWRNVSPYRTEFGDVQSVSDSNRDSNKNNDNDSNNTYYSASCYCGRVQYQVLGDPLASKICHCRACQMLHGAPFEWVSIFEKHHVRFDQKDSLDYLYFYNSELDQGWTSTQADSKILPCKVSCGHCRTPIADEGRNMWLAYGTLFRFPRNTIPDSFRHTDHLFYGQRCLDLHDVDTERKWMGHMDKSELWNNGKVGP